MHQVAANQTELRDLMNPLLIMQAPELPVTDKLFYQAYQNCKLSVTFEFLYASALLLLTPYFIFSIPQSTLQLYLIYLFLLQILQFYYYNTIRLVLRSLRIYYLLADKTEHLMYVSASELSPEVIVAEPRYLDYYDLRDPVDTDHQGKKKALSNEILRILVNSSRSIKNMHRFQFFFYQISHTSALLLLFLHDFSYSPAAKNLLIVIVLVGTYQYLEFYLLFIFVLIVLPYYFFKNSYNYAVLKYRTYKLQQNLHSERFSEKIAGDKDCKICFMPYEPDERIIILKCNEMHHFHSACIRRWTKNSVTCPMCRANLCEI